MTRVVNYHRFYMQGRLERLGAPWVEVLRNPNALTQRRDQADLALVNIYAMINDIEDEVVFDNDKLIR